MNRSVLLTLGLLGVLILSACTPTTSAPLPAETVAPQPATQEPAVPEPLPSEVSEVVPTTIPVETEPPTEEVVIQPTSRGDELEATDPTTVNIANGEPQLIEFFAFW